MRDRIHKYAGQPVTACKYCGAPIWFDKRKNGKLLAISKESGRCHFFECQRAVCAQGREGVGTGRMRQARAAVERKILDRLR